MSGLSDFLDWLFPKNTAKTVNAANTDIQSGVGLPQPKPGALVTDAPVYFQDPSSLPVASFYDVANTPDYSRVGVTQGGQSPASKSVSAFLASIQSQWGGQAASGNVTQAFVAPVYKSVYSTPPSAVQQIVAALTGGSPAPGPAPSAQVYSPPAPPPSSGIPAWATGDAGDYITNPSLNGGSFGNTGFNG